MFSVDCDYKGIKGNVKYDSKSKTVIITFDLMEARKQNKENEIVQVQQDLYEYLNKKRELMIPESQIIDDYRIDNVRPVTNDMYMELALSSVYAELNVFIDWGTQKDGTDCAL